MISKTIDPVAAVAEGILANQNSRLREDYRKVTTFAQLKGRPSRPIDEQINCREQADFRAVRALLPEDFFVPFDRVLEIVGRAALRVQPERAVVDTWNKHDFIPKVVADVCDVLDSGSSPSLVPALLSAFLNLERENLPTSPDWAEIGMITIPGSRTFDRAAEAFRAYLYTRGKALIVTSGKAPYYDPENESIELTESEANAAYLRLLGVPGDRIFVESESRDTQENADFLPTALDKVEKMRGGRIAGVMLVTSPFHLSRYHLSVKRMLRDIDREELKVYAIGSKASRYWPETYFLTDAKSGYTREATMGVVFNEYLKIAFDLCTAGRVDPKPRARRGM